MLLNQTKKNIEISSNTPTLSIYKGVCNVTDVIPIPDEIYSADENMCVTAILGLYMVDLSIDIPMYNLEWYNKNWDRLFTIIHPFLSHYSRDYMIVWKNIDTIKYPNLRKTNKIVNFE